MLNKNSIKACIHESQVVVGDATVRLRLLEDAKTPSRLIPKGTVITAGSKLQGGRLQLKISSLEFKGNIIPVDITVYDLDGQPGLYVHNSFEINAMTEMAGNMSQTSGASVMLMQSAGQQVATDLTGGVVQGISGYFAKNTDTKSGTKRRTSGISCFQTIMFNNKIIYSMKNNFILFLCTAFSYSFLQKFLHRIVLEPNQTS